MAKQLDLERYMRALKLIQGMCEKQVPIKKSQFLQDHKLSAFFWAGLEALGITKEEIGYKREGTIFTWTHKKADNESESWLANKLCGWITETNRKSHEIYADPKRIKKRTIRNWKEQQKIISKTQPASKEIIIEAPTPLPAPPQEQTPIPQEEKAVHTLMSLHLNGHLSKKELMEKLTILINDTPIASFKLEVQY